MPSCAECRVHIKEGESNVIGPSPKETSLIGSAYFVDNRRLSCQLRCFGDIVIDLTNQMESQAQTTKRPQGARGRVVEDSQAVMGTMILDERQNMADKMEKRANQMVEMEMRNQALRELKTKRQPSSSGGF